MERDITITSMSNSPTAQAELEHAAGPNWRQPFKVEPKTEEAKPEAKVEEPKADEVKTVEAKPEAKAEPKEDDEEPKGRWSKRVDTLTRRLKNLESELAEERRQKSDSARRPEAKTEPVKDPRAPKQEDFKGPTALEDYMRAQVKYELKVEQERQEQETESVRQREAYDAYNEGVRQLRNEVEDFDEVLDSLKNNSPISHTMQVSIIEADNGPEIVYYLAKNPDIREQIYELPLGKQAVEIGRLSLYLEAQKSEGKEPEKPEVKKEIKQSVAPQKPKPISPVGAKTSPVLELDKLSYQDYKLARRRQRAN
jgi:hypothetical protein